MNFKNGYLGACIIVLGIIATIIGSYALSIEVSDVEVTKYQTVADLNGLFDSEQAPAFIEYNPSTNYTGYYTDDSVIDGVKYFDGVDFNRSGQPNAYRLNLKPLGYAAGTNTNLPTTGTFNGEVRIWGVLNDSVAWIWGSDEFKNIRLSTFIQSLNLSADQNLITLMSVDGKEAGGTWETTDTDSVVNVNWVLFSADWEEGRIGQYVNNYSEAYNTYYSESKPLPKLSAKIDLTSNQVYLYYDNACKEQAGIHPLNDVVITFGNTDDNLSLGNSLKYIYQTKQDPAYMDIKGGVSVL